METSTLRFYTLNYRESKAYLVALAFITGNILLPQLCHLFPEGGRVLLPIYFFTLIGAYKYGWQVGLATSLFSPLVNSVLFGMPPVAVLPAILSKSVLLALFASIAARSFRRISVLILIGVVLSYQVVGTGVEWLITGSLQIASQDFRIALPGMLLQVLGGYGVVKALPSR